MSNVGLVEAVSWLSHGVAYTLPPSMGWNRGPGGSVVQSANLFSSMEGKSGACGCEQKPGKSWGSSTGWHPAGATLYPSLFESDGKRNEAEW